MNGLTEILNDELSSVMYVLDDNDNPTKIIDGFEFASEPDYLELVTTTPNENMKPIIF